MTSALEFILSPIIWIMSNLLHVFADATGSVGLAIILLAVTLSLVTQPLRAYAGRAETRISERIARVDSLKVEIPKEIKGEQRFNELERIYAQEGYHPIQNVLLASSLIIILPLLIAAFFLFTSGDEVLKTAFLFLPDLSEPDRLLFGLNALPLVMTLLTILDANLRFRSDRKARYRFYVIAIILLALVYTLPSSLIIYWMTSNAAYLGFWLTTRSRKPA